MLPMLLRIRVKSEEANFGFFLPLIIFYILALPLYVVVALVYLIMLMAGDGAREVRNYTKIAFYVPSLLKAAKGMEIEVHSDDSDVVLFIK